MRAPDCARIAVVGVTCSGKSTLANRLSRSLGLVRIELDALHWKPGWVGSDRSIGKMERFPDGDWSRAVAEDELVAALVESYD